MTPRDPSGELALGGRNPRLHFSLKQESEQCGGVLGIFAGCAVMVTLAIVFLSFLNLKSFVKNLAGESGINSTPSHWKIWILLPPNSASLLLLLAADAGLICKTGKLVPGPQVGPSGCGGIVRH